MGGILRRRGMMQTTGTLPEWDYEWDSSKGALTETGWVLSKAGTGASNSSVTNGYLSETATSTNYNKYTWHTDYSKGVLEADIYYDSNANNIRLNAPGSASYGLGVRIQYSGNYKGIYLGTSTSGTKLYTLSTYPNRLKIKLVLNNGVGQVYVDDVLITDNINTASMENVEKAFVSFRATGSYGKVNRLYSLKMKLGRI